MPYKNHWRQLCYSYYCKGDYKKVKEIEQQIIYNDWKDRIEEKEKETKEKNKIIDPKIFIIDLN